jgi:hypothetical protein
MFRNSAAVAAVVLGAFFGCELVAAETPARAANPDICPPSVTTPRPPSAAAAGPGVDLVLEFAKGAASRAGGAAFDFLLSRLGLGDRSPDQLKEIAGRLTDIQNKLLLLHDSLNDVKRRVDQVEFTTLMIAFDAVLVKVDSINTNGMQEVARAAENLADIMSRPHTPEMIEPAEACLQQKRQAYVELLSRNSADTNNAVITRLMSGAAGRGTLVNGYGRLLLSNRQFLSDAQSDALRAFYDYLEQYQALAAIQRAEWQIATGVSHSRIEQDNREFYNEIGIGSAPQGTIQIQRSLLPDPIPEGVRIDLGSAAADSTVGKTMLFPMGGVFGPHFVTFRSADSHGWAGPAEAVKVAADFVGPGVAELKDWKVIDEMQWTSLMARKPSAETGAKYLNDLFSLVPSDPSPGRYAPPFTGRDPHNYPLDRIWVNSAARQLCPTLTPKRREPWCWPIHAAVLVDKSGSMALDGPASVRVPWVPNAGDFPANRHVPTRVEFNALLRDAARSFDRAKGRLIVTRIADANYVGLKPQLPAPPP